MKKIDAIKHFGGIVKLAETLGIRPQAVSQWGKDIPIRRAYEIERLTKGKLKALPESEDNLTGQPT